MNKLLFSLLFLLLNPTLFAVDLLTAPQDPVILFQATTTPHSLVLKQAPQSALGDNKIYLESLEHSFNTINDHVSLEESRAALAALTDAELTLGVLAQKPFLLLDACKENRRALNSKGPLRDTFLEVVEQNTETRTNQSLVVVDYACGDLHFLLRSLVTIMKSQNLGKVILIDPQFKDLIFAIKFRDQEDSRDATMVYSDQITVSYKKSAYQLLQLIEAAQFLQPKSLIQFHIYSSAMDYAEESLRDEGLEAMLVMAFDYAVLNNPTLYAQNEIDLLLGGIALRVNGVIIDGSLSDNIRIQRKNGNTIKTSKDEILSIFKSRISYNGCPMFKSHYLVSDAIDEKKLPIFTIYRKDFI